MEMKKRYLTSDIKPELWARDVGKPSHRDGDGGGGVLTGAELLCPLSAHSSLHAFPRSFHLVRYFHCVECELNTEMRTRVIVICHIPLLLCGETVNIVGHGQRHLEIEKSQSSRIVVE